MENEKFYIGNYKEDAEKKRGWFVGHFIESGVRKTDKFEVKHWEYPPGKTSHPIKVQRNSIECTIILKGKIDGEVDGGRITLEAGQYIVIPPGITNGFPINVYEDVEGLTVKVPSVENDRKVISD